MVQSIAVTCAGRWDVRITEPAPMWGLRTAVSKEKEESGGKKGEEREGSVAQKYHRHDRQPVRRNVRITPISTDDKITRQTSAFPCPTVQYAL